jgi:UDP-N-acetylglucosamine transferase subunit ALG13
MSNESRTLLVTVGSTLFSSLTDRVLSASVLDVLASQGITTLIVQYGAATLPNVTGSARLVLDAAGAGETTWTSNAGCDTHIQVMRYSERYTQLVASADAVISHAGEPFYRVHATRADDQALARY